MTEMMEYFLIIFCAGNFIFMIFVVSDDDVFSQNVLTVILDNLIPTVSLTLSILNAALPM